ncbi:MAG: sugar ABC transporter permease [Chloroflexota bacterium]|nr:sugar ABC transporter permease [Chloroflexota bacterium]
MPSHQNAQREAERLPEGGISDRNLALLLVVPAGILLLLFSVYPFVQAAIDSFFRIPLAGEARTYVGWDNYQSVFQDESIRNAFFRSIWWTVANIIIQAGLGLAIALVLNQKLRGRDLARGLVLFPYMVPAVSVALLFRYTFNDITGIATYLMQQLPWLERPPLFLAEPDIAMWTVIAVNSWKYTPFITIVLLARLQTVPRDLYEAARIDGASAWQMFRDITFPWLRPVFLIALLLRTIWTVNDFDVIYLLAFGGPLNATTTLPIEIRRLAFGQQDLGLASALAVVMAVFIAIISFVYLRMYQRSEERLL